MTPIKMTVPENVFLEKLAALVLECTDVPNDGKWREISLRFEVRNIDDGPGIYIDKPFLIGGPSAG